MGSKNCNLHKSKGLKFPRLYSGFPAVVKMIKDKVATIFASCKRLSGGVFTAVLQDTAVMLQYSLYL